MKKYILPILAITILALFSRVSLADVYSGSNFKVLDPVIAPGSYASSVGFKLWSNISGISVATSSSASYKLNPGFLAFLSCSLWIVHQAQNEMPLQHYFFQNHLVLLCLK
jgi:hypothetical protein